MRTAADTSKQLKREWEEAKANPRYIYGYGRYGDGKQWAKLDALTGGLQKINLGVLVARPKTGKSMMAAAWVPHIAEQADRVGQVVRIVTLETTRMTYQRRMAALMAAIKDPKNIKRGMLTEDEEKEYLRALDWLEMLPIEYLDNRDLDESAALKFGNSPISFDKMSKFIIDPGDTYWWLLDHVGLLSDLRGGDNRTYLLYKLADQLADLAHTYCTGVMITHLNRETSHGKPTLSSIGGADQIGRNADQIFTIWRPWMEEEEEDRRLAGVMEHEPAFLLFNSRDEGSGMVQLMWHTEYAAYTELIVEDGAQMPLLLPPGMKKK